jgi:3'-phosphoadenosine 5'-phosphosulfate sulfotransferase (PAPS reductase)/FAD synthetase
MNRLDTLVGLSKGIIRNFYNQKKGKVYVSFSGGRDSTVMLDIARELYPDMKAMHIKTGLEYPEIEKFVEEFDNVDIVIPKMTFPEVLAKYGYPVISKEQAYYIYQARNTKSAIVRDWRMNGVGPKKRFKISEKWKFLLDAPFKISNKCCDVQKKFPAKKYDKQTGTFPLIGLMQSDSYNRKFLLQRTCSNYYTINKEYPIYRWTEQDILDYIKSRGLKYCSIYDTGVKHTGCMYCLFGCQAEPNPNRFELMRQTHPQIYNYCINTLGIGEVLDYIGVKY